MEIKWNQAGLLENRNSEMYSRCCFPFPEAEPEITLSLHSSFHLDGLLHIIFTDFIFMLSSEFIILKGALKSAFCGTTYLFASELKWSWDPFWTLGKLTGCITKNSISILVLFFFWNLSKRTSGIYLKGLVAETWIKCCGLFDFPPDVWVSRYIATF